MARDYHVRTTWIATLVAGAIALGATTGVVSITGHPLGDVAQAAIGEAHAAAARRAAATARVATEPSPSAAHATATADAPAKARERDHAKPAAAQLLARIPTSMPVRARPDAHARVVGTLVSSSKYYDVALTAWIEATAKHGRWGRVTIPYAWPHREGWIPLRGLARSRTFVEVHVDLSKHWITVTKFGKTLFGARAATGAPSSPTPDGRYFVTDRIPFAAGGPLGTFAFGISGIQPRLPAGWSGGNQLAIHGTSDPASIGTSASAGCMRVSERTLRRLLPLLRLGTPVLIQP